MKRITRPPAHAAGLRRPACDACAAGPRAGAARPTQAQIARALRGAARRQDELLAILAHELRAPLQTIRSAVDLLGDVASPALHVIERQTALLARLVDDLGEATRAVHGKSHLQREAVCLQALLGVLLDDPGLLRADGSQRVHLRVPSHEVWVHADPSRLTQVFGNLLHNAIKFSPADRPVRLELRHATGAAQAEVSVTDEGVGMAPARIATMFDLFAQGDGPAPGGRRGLGIGLSVVRSLVERHGGSVSAHSDGPGKGSRFAVTLDTIEAPADPGRLRRVLLVEDHEDAGTVLKLLLEAAGHDVALASNGRAALDQAARWRPDTVLLDIGLPDIDGYEVARRLRGDATRPPPRLIALSGDDGAGTVQALRRAGFDDWLVKPATLDALSAALLATDAAQFPRTVTAQP